MMKNMIARLRRDEKGASMVEYAVALLVVVAVGVATMSLLGGEVNANVEAGVAALQGDGFDAQ